MHILSICITVVATSVQSAFKKRLNATCQNCEFTLSAMITLVALFFFLIFSKNLTFSMEILPYSLGYAICYATAAATCVLALACGSLALTDLILSYCSIIPLGYSLIFLGERLNFLQVIGVICLCISFFLTYYRKKKGKWPLSLKWIIYVLLLFVSNGMCGVLVRMQQIRFHAQYDRSFMVISLIIVVLILGTAAVLRERKNLLSALRHGAFLSAMCGTSNGIANYFSFICLMHIPNSIYFPVTSAAGLVLSCLISQIIFKEKLRPIQYAGITFGVLAMVFINLT